MTRLLTSALAVSLLSCNVLLAGKGGNQPPKNDPPPAELPNVRYQITPVSIPGTGYYFNNHNEAGALVGWYTGGDAGTGARAMAYLPSISSTEAVDLNGPQVGAVGIPDGWHLRSALDINIHGDIVGRISPDDPDDSRSMSFYLDINSTPPSVTVIEPANVDAPDEMACCINDSGDMVICSNDKVREIHVGNLGLYGNSVIPFSKVDFEALTGYPRDNRRIPVLSNRRGDLPAVVASELDVSSGWDEPFRMAFDSSWFEFAQPYQDSDGNLLELRHVRDINDFGDVGNSARITKAKKGNASSGSTFGSVWTFSSSEYVPIAASSALNSPWYSAMINNEGDSIVNNAGGSVYALYHGTWSETNGVVCDIRSLIHPDDPFAEWFLWADDLTDRVSIGDVNSQDELDYWPVILAKGSYTLNGVDQRVILILDPVAFP